MKKGLAALAMVVSLSGCTTLQQVNKLDASAGKLNLVCVVEHKAVRESVLEVVGEGLTNHGIKYRVIPGSYVIKNNLWTPTFQDSDAAGCDAMLFYVAQWNWDIAMYMHFANIWMSTPDRSKNLGFARYEARASMNKFINARAKLLELEDQLFEQYKNPTSAMPKPAVANAPAAMPVTNASPTSVAPEVVPPKSASTEKKADEAVTAVSPTAQKLRELQDLKKNGLISEEDYQAKKKQLLEKY